MGRAKRVDVGGYAYHVINRGNGRMTIFDDEGDYDAFERVLDEALIKFPQVHLLAYCLMPNHWHLVLHPQADKQLSRFVGWLTLTHTQRWHAHRHTTGGGHVYQGRYKSFLIETDVYLSTVCRYVERNPVRANLVRKAENWKWSSLHRWLSGSPEEKRILSPWPTPSGKRPPGWLKRVNTPETQAELDALRLSCNRERPFGSEAWAMRIMKKYDLATTFRPRGRPQKQASK
ncbi:transposase [Poriferisphaera sp. WC338]|uniref:transposase n=1 Tax=Poriferisphaera sp. WC338 TaxID=3425129 RepID=UPI003D81B1C4